MQLHTAQVRDRRIAWDRREVVQHGLNADAVVLDLDAEWRECDRIQAVLAGAGGPIRILVEGGRFNLPSALMEAPGAIRMCLMGHVGEAVRIVTAKEAKPLTVVESGDIAGIDPAPEQPDLWAQLMEEVRKATEGAKTAAQSATRAEADLRAAAERGDFDGEDGKTPVRGVDYWTEADRKPIEDATDAALTSAGKADAAAEKASVGEASRAASEVERVANEAERVEAESGRKSAEATRAAHESERTESFNTNLVSWNSKVDAACKKATDTASKAAQDAKTATDAAIAKTEEATQAAVANADKATASATTAANKAEAAVSKLPLPLGNTLKGEAESTFINLHDSWKAPILKGKVLGQSNQLTTTGKNLIKLDEAIKTSQGLELDIKSSGQLSINGTCAGSGLWLKIGTVDVVEGKTYYLSLNKPFPSFGISAWSNTDNKHVIFASSKLQVAKGVAAKTETLSIFAAGGNDTTFNNELVYVQIEEGQKTNWEPYTGGKPSPSPEYPQEITNLNKAEIVTSGINICPDDKLLAFVSYNNGIPTFSKKLPPAKFPYNQKSETDCIGAVLNTKKGVTYSIAYLGSAATAAVGIAEYKAVEDGVDLNKAVSYAMVGSSKKASLTATIDGVMCFALGSRWKDGKTNLNTFNKEDMIISVGEPYSTYTPHQSKSTPIDLQGNELCSVTEHREWSPNTFRDELVIDSEGNVNLVKRVFSAHIDGLEPMSLGATSTFQYFSYAPKTVRPIDGSIAICSNRFGEIGREPWKFYVAGGSNAGIFFTFPLETFANDGELNEWLKSNPIDVNYLGAEAQTIPLGKVELPALPEATSNVWNDGNIPANVYINYLKDVNIAYTDLENQIKQITAALSVMDTPTIIPEI